MDAAQVDTKNRFVYGEPAEIYHQRVLGVASNGALKLIDEKTPMHYKHWVESEEDEEERANLSFGKAYHCAVLEPEVFAETFVCVPADAPADLRRFRDAKKPSQATLDSIAWWDEFEEMNQGRTFIDFDKRETFLAMSASQRAMRLEIGGHKLTLAELIDVCAKEVSGYWIDPETGLQCKLRFDLLSEELRFGGDLKTAMNAGEDAFARVVASHRYDQQQAHYTDGYKEITGHALRSFMFLPIEKAAPYVPAAWTLGEATEQRGWDLRQRAIRKLHKCVTSDTWPGYASDARPINVPAWAYYGIENA